MENVMFKYLINVDGLTYTILAHAWEMDSVGINFFTVENGERITQAIFSRFIFVIKDCALI